MSEFSISPPYNLFRTLTCGQAFRWRVDGDTAHGVFAGRPVTLRQRDGGIEVSGLGGSRERDRLSSYLGLDQPLSAIEQALGADRVLRRILPSTTGIALIRQDPWECLVSFVVSAFNNIPKIELTLDRLCRTFGDRLGETAWSFPSPDRLARAGLSELRRCLLGYRAPYVRALARCVDGGRFDLAAPAGVAYEEARVLLLDLPGVGEKVADCVLLFAYGRGEAFPVDVWVKRAVERRYFRGASKSVRDIQVFARGRFSTLAGYAQQHLYSYERTRGREVRS
jgi:N-glycosylase/DNA lyase